jgi:beta-ribofuranosylaminobenzene 5'-phosphate synthase
MLDWPTTEVVASSAAEDDIVGLDRLDLEARQDVSDSLIRLREIYRIPPTRLVIRRFTRQHIGLGSKTTMLLAAISAIAAAHNLRISAQVARDISGRGGVSGIGLHGFYSGGLLVDAGHSQDMEPHRPSGEYRPPQTPLLMLRARIPPTWLFFLILPKGRTYAGGSETDLFSRYRPTGPDEALQAIALLYHGIIPGLLTSDVLLLRRSLLAFQRTAFKSYELENQDPDVRQTLEALEGVDHCAVGMSSVGPLLYLATTLPRDQIEPALSDICVAKNAELLYVCRGVNHGRLVVQESSHHA